MRLIDRLHEACLLVGEEAHDADAIDQIGDGSRGEKDLHHPRVAGLVHLAQPASEPGPGMGELAFAGGDVELELPEAGIDRPLLIGELLQIAAGAGQLAIGALDFGERLSRPRSWPRLRPLPLELALGDWSSFRRASMSSPLPSDAGDGAGLLPAWGPAWKRFGSPSGRVRVFFSAAASSWRSASNCAGALGENVERPRSRRADSACAASSENDISATTSDRFIAGSPRALEERCGRPARSGEAEQDREAGEGRCSHAVRKWIVIPSRAKDGGHEPEAC